MPPRNPAEVEAELRAYYDEEGDERLLRPIDSRRMAARDRFMASLSLRGAQCVLEVGSGPGRDAATFIEAGYRHVAVDLSIEHARRCRSTGAQMVLASVAVFRFGQPRSTRSGR